MKSLIQRAIRQKIRLDLGMWVLQPIQFCFIAIAASGRFSDWVHLPVRVVAPLLVLASFAAWWLSGYILDKCGALQIWNQEANSRNELLTDLANRK